MIKNNETCNPVCNFLAYTHNLSLLKLIIPEKHGLHFQMYLHTILHLSITLSLFIHTGESYFPYLYPAQKKSVQP